MLDNYAIPVIGSTKLSDIKRADLAAIYRRLDNMPSVVRAMHATLRKMFNWAMSRDDLKHSPAKGAEAPAPPKPRTRYLSDAELACAWTKSFRLAGNYGALFRMMMLTRQRRGEAVGLDWSDLSRSRKEWVLPGERTKNGYACCSAQRAGDSFARRCSGWGRHGHRPAWCFPRRAGRRSAGSPRSSCYGTARSSTRCDHEARELQLRLGGSMTCGARLQLACRPEKCRERLWKPFSTTSLRSEEPLSASISATNIATRSVRPLGSGGGTSRRLLRRDKFAVIDASGPWH